MQFRVGTEASKSWILWHVIYPTNTSTDGGPASSVFLCLYSLELTDEFLAFAT